MALENGNRDTENWNGIVWEINDENGLIQGIRRG